ncbi:TonB-dependent receptor [Sphingosinicella terrae]|uniref:TonB-dependent receptor n=1 Tax=Sphingosinicella terrae TaxID=2172047 RepID=UPI000E0DFD24|nr:TonB-dependent receptor [Sphingosinicella terrae]
MSTGSARRRWLAASAAGLAWMPAAASAQAGAPSDSAGAEEEVILVTAQKREEDVQDVPASISVVGGEALVRSGATQIQDFAGYVPGLHGENRGTAGGTRVALRGISPLGANATVGVYVDDAPVGSATPYTESGDFTVDLLPYDLARIEILRGPQGTLYGASTIGGLIKYVTVAPDLDDFSGRVGAELFGIRHGGEAGYAVQGMVNVPLVEDRLAVTASLAHRSTPGWIDNVQTGERDQNGYEQTGGRLSLLWRPAEAFTVRLSALYQELDQDSVSTTAQSAAGVPVGNGRSNFNYVAEPFRSEFEYYSATLDYDLGPATLSSTTSFSRIERFERVDASRIFGILFPLLTGGAVPPGVTPFDNRITLDKWTEEVRLTSASGGRFEWMAGFFYTGEEALNEQLVFALDQDLVPIPGLDPLATVAIPSTYDEYALFANATFRITDRFRVTGGLRWAHNDQTFRQVSAGAIVPAADRPGESSEGVWTYSLSPQFHFTEDMMVYARVANGYRPGGPNVVVPGLPATVDADRVTNYELGFKTRLADPALSIDVALFRMDWTDIQVPIQSGGIGGLGNGGTARSQGIEAALSIEPAPGLTFGANGAYTDSELTQDAPGVGGLAGDRLPNIPKFSGSLTADYSFRPGPRTEARIGAGLRHVGRRLSAVESNPLAVGVSAYTALDLNASVTLDDRFTLRAFARNLTGSEGPSSRTLIADGLNQPAYINAVPLQPRTIGLAVDVAF